MNFQNIEYFLTVAEFGNFTKAAQSLYISQQSLSENIRRLEEEVGTPLFERGGKTLTLTPAGKCFYSGGSKILKTQDKVLREIAIISKTTRCKIVLDVPPMDLPPFLPQVLKEYSQKYPEYELCINPKTSVEMADLTFSINPPEKSAEAIPLIEKDPFSVVIGHTLAEQIYGDTWSETARKLRQDQNLSILAQMPFLLLYVNKCLAVPMATLFQDAGFTPKEAFKSEDSNLLCSLCMSGAGAFIGPMDYCRRKFGPLLDEVSGSLSCYPLKTPASTTLILTYPKGKRLNQAEKRFIDVLRSVIDKT